MNDSGMTIYNSDRLIIRDLKVTDGFFILQLLNTKGWLRFIGDREVRTLSDSKSYIEKIQSDPTTEYWVVVLKKNRREIGIVTLIKRDYLDYHDVGFAFLPEYEGEGYAFEATNYMIDIISKKGNHSTLLATTIDENHRSIKLLEKLNFKFKEKIDSIKGKLQVYQYTENGSK